MDIMEHNHDIANGAVLLELDASDDDYPEELLGFTESSQSAEEPMVPEALQRSLENAIVRLIELNDCGMEFGLNEPKEDVENEQDAKIDAMVWLYFRTNNKPRHAVCRMCRRQLLFEVNRTEVLKRHLYKVHNIVVDKDHCFRSDLIKTVYKYQPELNCASKGVIKSEMKLNKRKVFRSYIGLLLDDNIPLEILDSQNMRNLIEPICIALTPLNYDKEAKRKPLQLNAQSCQRALHLVANNVRNELKNKLRQHLVSLKIDSIYSANTSTNMFALNAQFIQGDGLEIILLGMLKLKSGDINANFNADLLNILKKYQIDYDQVASITIDNDASIALNDLDFNDFLVDGDSERTNYLAQIEQYANPAPICVGDDIEVQRCAAHTAQLCTLALLKNAEICEHICNCRKLTKLLNDFPREIFEIHGLELPVLDCPTRWGSTYAMIDALLAARDILEDITAIKIEQDDDEEVETHQHQLTNPALWEFCDAYLHILNPLQKILLIFQEKQLHCGDFYARWLKCKIRTNKLLYDVDNTTIKHRLGSCLLTCIEQATTRLLTNASFCACLFLDPRFHNTLNAERKSRSIKYLENLWTKVNSFKTRNAIVSTSIVAVAEPLVQNEFSDDEDAMLNEFLSKELKKKDSSAAVSVRTKIEKLQLPFVRSDANVLQFWLKKQCTDPELFELSNICFAIPTTQITDEIQLSALESLLASNRNCLSVDALEDKLLVQQNPNYLDDAIETLSLFEDCPKVIEVEDIKVSTSSFESEFLDVTSETNLHT